MASINNKSAMINIPRIQVFRPTLEEMKNFEQYINKIESLGAHKAGLAKIIPPPEWKPRPKDPDYQSDEIDRLTIKAPIQQIVQGRLGLYQQYNIQKKSLTVKEFKKLAESTKYRTIEFFDYEDLERRYWKNVTYNAPIYGADVPGTLYDNEVDEFNINRLDTILDLVNESYGIKIMGVNTAYLYFGMWKTTFAWHTEDMDLYSINYLHFGAPKSWYCVPPEHGRRLERLAAGFFPTSVTSCPAFLRHKMTLISPAVLKQYSIPFNKITQEAGEFMVTFPYSYHAGYNHGYNCAESTNFATERWVEYGKRATRCNCRSDSVKISMEAFVKKFQPDRYDLWLSGKDIGPHPEDPTHISPAPLPSDYELQVLSKVSKSKRHPPYKPEPEVADSKSMSPHHSGRMQVMTTFPTKAALKHFETPGPSNQDLQHIMNKNDYGEDSASLENREYLQTNPPDLKEAVKRMRDRFAPKNAPKKRSKKTASGSSTISSPSDSNNDLTVVNPQKINPLAGSTAKTLCNPQPDSYIPLTWVTKGGHDPSAVQLIDRFLKCDFNPPNMRPSTSKYFNTNASSTTHSPTPPISSSKLYRDADPCSKPSPSTYYPSISQRQFDQPSTSTYYYEAEQPSSSTSSHFQIHASSDPSIHFHQSDEHTSTITTGYYHQHPNQPKQPPLPHSLSSPETTNSSTLDLSVGGIALKPKLNRHDDLSNLLADDPLNREMRELLKRVPVQPYLYQHLPYNFFDEQILNCCMSCIYPHCCICIVMRQFEIHEDWVEGQAQIPSSSPILLPRAAFSSATEDSVPLLIEENESPLLVCSDCKVCVHSICYGIDPLETIDPTDWRCDRCKKEEYGSHCCLCPFRGGALKRTKDERKWVHMVCALPQPEVQFLTISNQLILDVSSITKQKAHSPFFKCIYCQKTNAKLSDYISGFCIQCWMAPRCSSKFHTTCAFLNGAKFQRDDWPDPLKVFCSKCAEKSKNGTISLATEDEIDLGTVVLAKHRNRRYYEALVTDKTFIIMHHAHLEDNSVLQVIRTSDILEPDIEKDGIPDIGDSITIFWDKTNQVGRYAGNHTIVQYVLKFEDESIIRCFRESFYRLDEEIPAKVQVRRSQATVVKNESLFWATNLKQHKKQKQIKDEPIASTSREGGDTGGGTHS